AFPFFEEARQTQALRKQCRIGSRGRSRSGCITALERARYNKESGMIRGMKRGMVTRSRLLAERAEQHEFNGIPTDDRVVWQHAKDSGFMLVGTGEAAKREHPVRPFDKARCARPAPVD